MFGVIIGDVVGAPYETKEYLAQMENKKIDSKQRAKILNLDVPLFTADSRFTDDTVLTIATCDAILTSSDFAHKYKEYGRKYFDAGYGKLFKEWIIKGDLTPNPSFSNGSAIRVSPIAYSFDTLEEVLEWSQRSAQATHDHLEAIRGAQAISCCVFLARKNYDKVYIKNFVTRNFEYDLDQTLDQIRPSYTFDSSCKGSVPQAIIAFLESKDFEDAIRKALSLGGDSDSIASMTGAIAEAYYKVIPQNIIDEALSRLDKDLINVLYTFKKVYKC